MKKRIRIFVVALLLICSLSSTVPAYAATSASDQISTYFMDAGAMSGGQIAIEFSITGVYRMAVIGAKSIMIYEKNGSYWSYADGCT